MLALCLLFFIENRSSHIPSSSIFLIWSYTCIVTILLLEFALANRMIPFFLISLVFFVSLRILNLVQYRQTDLFEDVQSIFWSKICILSFLTLLYIIYQVHLFWRYVSIVILSFQILQYKPILCDSYPFCNISP